LPSDDSVVREKAVESLKSIGLKLSPSAVYSDYLPMVKRMRKGDLFSMRISACFLYAQIYERLDSERRAYARTKFLKLSKDDTPMVRRGAAQSLSILAEFIEEELSKDYTVPLLKALLQDDNDSVKIMAVYSALPIVRRLLRGQQQLIKEQVVPPLKQAAENKMITWRLRFSVADVAA
jgi:serine/threonine-protein phosphatase 2A regulatory subunit A